MVRNVCVAREQIKSFMGLVWYNELVTGYRNVPVQSDKDKMMRIEL